jgi:membrane-associated protease RseP (regulator of RpoE activity)
VNTPDYQAQAQWLAWADQRVQKEQAISDFNSREWLRANTLFRGTAYAGRLIFVRDKSFRSGVVRISIEARNYEFAFPAPQSARPPETAPALPAVGSLSSSLPSGMTTLDAPTEGATETGAITSTSAPTAWGLGISGANWEEGGVRGVEILGVAQDSVAEASGLHRGNIILGINGRKIHSTQDLARVLAQNGPDSSITVGYVFKSNLGWMPTETVVVLAK